MANANEVERLNALRQLNLLDTPPSESFDRITRMASQLFNLPIAAVSLTDADRQWFKSRVGVEHWSIPRHKAPCAQVAETEQVLVIADLLKDPHYRDSILAKSGVRFYAGAPLITAQGHSLGAMCVLGTDARETTAEEIAVLGDLASMVMAQIELQHAFGRIDPITGLSNRTQFFEDSEDRTRDEVLGERQHLVLLDLIESHRIGDAGRVLGPSYIDDLVRAAAVNITSTLGPQRKAYQVAATQIAFFARPDIAERDLVDMLSIGVRDLELAVHSRLLSTVAVGVAPFRFKSDFDPVDLLRMAHSAAQDARHLETRVSIYSHHLDEGHRRRHILVQDFADALLSGDQLRLAFQPRIEIATGQAVGAEALLRWNHPHLGEVSPAEFIPLIEQTTLAKPMTDWVLKTAIHQQAHWRTRGVDLAISINVSAANLQETDFLSRLQDTLIGHNVSGTRIELEVTESAMMTDSSKALSTLKAISDLGVDLAIDDFGTGYSSLAYLQQLPAKVVKIDQSFIFGLEGDRRKQGLVKTMIDLCHNFNYSVVAEGVETQEALAVLAEAGCDQAQGYFFARPLDPDKLLAWIEARGKPRGLIRPRSAA